jgi:hypothetical protein
MSNPKEHCNMGFNHLCIVEGGAFDYTIRLGEAPPAPVEIRVSGTFLQYEPVVVFTPADYNEPHTITLVVHENLDISGNYWMELTHTVSLSDDAGSWERTDVSDMTSWWTTREPTIANVTAWMPGKLWCDNTGAALPLNMPVLIVENDVSFPDDLTWEMETLATVAVPVVRGPFTLDETFFSAAYMAALNNGTGIDGLVDNSTAAGSASGSASWSESWEDNEQLQAHNASGFWNADMPDVAFRIKGAGNGTFIFRP